ncbi:MAG TPA: M48 family metallopeptidase [Abditibacteriaceae bacterium]|nr:M48 family metallopeptidase [Abditibacteriaceae bacterium]
MHLRSSRRLCVLWFLASSFSAHIAWCAAPSPENPPPAATKKEIELGNKSAAELEKDPKIKFLKEDDPKAKALLEKLNKMAAEIGKASARPLIQYKIRVIDDKDLNAFTLPNGQIYLFQGLIDFAGSDDEIAAVIAHEIAHNARLHALRGAAKARKLSWVGLAAMMAALAGGQTGGNIAQFSQYLLVGIMNGYSVDYEKEADQAAISQLAKTGYNPSAMVTVMQRLGMEEQRRPDVELGIFRTHPPSHERTTAAIAALKEAGLPYTPRDVAGATQVLVLEDKDRLSLKLGAATLMEFAAPQAPATKERAQRAAQHINQLLRANLKLHEITAQGDSGGARLLARGVEVARITAEDARLQNLTPLACAEKWRDSFRRLFWSEIISGKM